MYFTYMTYGSLNYNLKSHWSPFFRESLMITHEEKQLGILHSALTGGNFPQKSFAVLSSKMLEYV